MGPTIVCHAGHSSLGSLSSVRRAWLWFLANLVAARNLFVTMMVDSFCFICDVDVNPLTFNHRLGLTWAEFFSKATNQCTNGVKASTQAFVCMGNHHIFIKFWLVNIITNMGYTMWWNGGIM